MSPIFQRAESQKNPEKRALARMPRHSSGWKKILERLKEEPGMRVLDIGPTSPGNINFLTSLGHSVYMADLVEEAIRPEWLSPEMEGEAPRYNTRGFIERHMDFGDRHFEIVLLWDALDYIPGPIGEAIVQKLADVLTERGQTLAFFHSKMTGPETVFCRYHVQDGDSVETQEGTGHPVLRNYQNRQIESMLEPLGSCRFLLAKDNTREVIVSR